MKIWNADYRYKTLFDGYGGVGEVTRREDELVQEREEAFR